MKDIFILFLVIISALSVLPESVLSFKNKNYAGGLFTLFIVSAVIFLGIFVLILGDA